MDDDQQQQFLHTGPRGEVIWYVTTVVRQIPYGPYYGFFDSIKRINGDSILVRTCVTLWMENSPFPISRVMAI